MNILEAAQAIAEAVEFGAPSARKSGRHPQYPYVPIIQGSRTTQQIMRLAYATREEAIQAAERHIANNRRRLAADLLEPRKRALREQYGLPRDLS